MSYGSLNVGGVLSTNYNIYVLGVDDANVPTRDYSVFSVPGRSRDLHYDNGRWNNIDRTYHLYTHTENGTSAETYALSFIAARMQLTGYQQIRDSIHSDYYKKGEFKGGVEPVFSRFSDGVRFDLVFDCDGRKYLETGLTEVDISNTGSGTWKSYSLEGQGTLKSRPVLKFSGFSGSNCGVQHGNLKIMVDSYNGTLVYDTELGDAYDATTHANLNSYVTLTGDFTELSSDTNSLSVKQGATVKIIPNWCKL